MPENEDKNPNTDFWGNDILAKDDIRYRNDEDTKSGTHPDMVMQDDIPPILPEIPTPEQAYRTAIAYLDQAGERVEVIDGYDEICAFYMEKAKVWAILANVNSFGSVLLESGPPWVGGEVVELNPTDEEDDRP